MYVTGLQRTSQPWQVALLINLGMVFTSSTTSILYGHLEVPGLALTSLVFLLGVDNAGMIICCSVGGFDGGTIMYPLRWMKRRTSLAYDSFVRCSAPAPPIWRQLASPLQFFSFTFFSDVKEKALTKKSPKTTCKFLNNVISIFCQRPLNSNYFNLYVYNGRILAEIRSL